MNNISILVPYRNRENHLLEFVPRLKSHIPNCEIYVAEQADSKPFNRGKLLNALFIEFAPTFFVCHDVDLLPIKVDYSPTFGVTQLVNSDIQKVGYLGGVTMFDIGTFKKIGGYHNDYFHRAEDNELAFQIQRVGIRVNARIGTFVNLPHQRTGPEFIPELWQKAQIPRNINMLENCHYTLISRENKGLYTLIKVEL